MIKLNLQFYAKKSEVDEANDYIDKQKAIYNDPNSTQAQKDQAHANAEAKRSEMSDKGYVAGNYVQSASKSSKNSNIDNSNYTYDASTNYERVYEPLDEEPKVPLPSGGSGDFNALANQYADAKKQAQINQLNKSYNNVLNQIAMSEENANANAQAGKNRASVQNQLATARLNRLYNNLGLANSGTNAQMNLNQAGALQNSLTDLDNTRNKALNELQNQRVLAKSNLESDINSVGQNIDAQMLEAQMNRLLNQEQMAQQLANQKELLAMQEDYNNIWDDTLGRYVPFNFYATTHNIVGTSTGGSSSGRSITTSTTKNNGTETENPNGIVNNIIDYDDLPDKTKNLAKINEAIMNKELTYDYLMTNEGFNFLMQAGLSPEEIAEARTFAWNYGAVSDEARTKRLAQQKNANDYSNLYGSL